MSGVRLAASLQGEEKDLERQALASSLLAQLKACPFQKQWRGLLCRAVFAAGVGYAGNEPFTVFADEVEEVGAAMVDFPVDEEVKGSPYDCEIVVDADEWVVDSFLNLRGARSAYSLSERVEGHLRGLAVAHQNHGSTGEQGLFDCRRIAFGHAVEHRFDRSQDRLLFRS